MTNKKKGDRDMNDQYKRSSQFVVLTTDSEQDDDSSSGYVTTETTLDLYEAVVFDDTHIPRDRFYGLFKGHIRNNEREELRAIWVELFFDLIYAACIIHLSAEVASHHITLCHNEWKYAFLLTGFAQFGLFTQTWRDQVLYVTYFVFTQRMDECLSILYMLCILAMGIFIHDNPEYHDGFQTAYILVRFVSILMHIKVLMIPSARYYAMYQIALSLCMILLLLVSMVTEFYDACSMDYFIVYAVVFVVDYIGYCVMEYQLHMKVNIEHISERFGLFILIILGESIISILTTEIGDLDLKDIRFKADGTPPDMVLIVFILLAFIMAYCIARLYYNCQPPAEHIEETGHALHKAEWYGRRLYTYSHQVLFIGLLGLGIGIKITGKHLLYPKKQWIDVLLPGYSLVIIVISLNLIRISHPYNTNYKVWLFRLILIVIMSIIPAFAMKINQGIIFGVIFMCILLMVCVDVEGKLMMRHSKH
eukprot:271360_1